MTNNKEINSIEIEHRLVRMSKESMHNGDICYWRYS